MISLQKLQELNLNRKRKAIIVSVPPWSGRATVIHYQNLNNFKIINLSSGKFALKKNLKFTDENLSNKENKNLSFPSNLINAVSSLTESFDFILIGQILEVFKALQEKNISYVLVLYNNDYIKEFKNRVINIVENNKNLPQRMSKIFINTYFEEYIVAMEKECTPIKKYYLKDVNSWFDYNYLENIYNDFKNLII
jgi:hypothetical protein